MKKRFLRSISGILAAVIFTVSAASSLFAQPGTTPDWSTLSAWAEEDVKEAYELGILQSYEARDFKDSITRENFCFACAMVLSLWLGCDYGEFEDIPELKEIMEKSDFSGFSDTGSLYVEVCARLGIVSGMGDGTFAPDSSITREQAAKMLYNTLNVGTDIIAEAEADNEYGVNGIFLPHVFNDGAEIDNWARNEIYTVYNLGIMTGDTENNFDPLGTYTKEQAYSTFIRLYKTEISPQELKAPDSAVYPSAENVFYYNDKIGYYLDKNGVWYSEEYEPVYYDGFGNTYTSEEKGCIYPIEKKYMSVLTNSGVGVGEWIIIDRSGNEITDIFYSLKDLTDKGAIITYSYDKGEIYNFETGDVISAKASYAGDIGCGIKSYYDGEYVHYLNSDYEPFMQGDYKPVGEQTFLNNLCVLRNKDDSFIVVNTDGEILKTFRIDLEKYYVDSVYGTNIILGSNTGSEDVVLRAYSGVYINGYKNISFTSKGDISAYRANSPYILDKSGNLICDLAAEGYDFFYDKGDYYIFYKENDTNYSVEPLFDVMDSKGSIIKTGVTSFDISLSEDGLYAYKSGENEITVFDGKGIDTGIIKTDSGIEEFRFINGLLNIKTNTGYKYYTPDGKEALKNAWVDYKGGKKND